MVAIAKNARIDTGNSFNFNFVLIRVVIRI
jgi:hypothetical protein